MTEEHRHSEQEPIRTWEETTPAAAESEGPESTVVRAWVEMPREEETATLPCESKERPRRPILLYRDENVIREMRSRIVAVALRDEGVLEELGGWVSGRRPRAQGLTVDGLAGVDEFILKSIDKRSSPGEPDVECELKWQLGDDTDIDHITLMLLAVTDSISVADFVGKVSSQRPDTPAEELIYPGMPTCLVGTVTKKPHIARDVLALRESRRVVRVLLMKENPLEQLTKYLYHRHLYVLGIVHDIEKLRSIEVRAGAVFAGDKGEGQGLRS